MSESGPAMRAYGAWHVRYPLSRALPISNRLATLADAAIAELEAENARLEWKLDRAIYVLRVHEDGSHPGAYSDYEARFDAEYDAEHTKGET